MECVDAHPVMHLWVSSSLTWWSKAAAHSIVAGSSPWALPPNWGHCRTDLTWVQDQELQHDYWNAAVSSELLTEAIFRSSQGDRSQQLLHLVKESKWEVFFCLKLLHATQICQELWCRSLVGESELEMVQVSLFMEKHCLLKWENVPWISTCEHVWLNVGVPSGHDWEYLFLNSY